MVRSAIDPIRPGASLILAWQIKQRHAIIIGGGFVAAGRKTPQFMTLGLSQTELLLESNLS